MTTYTNTCGDHLALKAKRIRTRFDHQATSLRSGAGESAAGANTVSVATASVVYSDDERLYASRLVFPQLKGAPQQIDVRFLSEVPGIAEPFAHALLRKLAPDAPKARATLVKWVRLGFYRFLLETDRRALQLPDIGGALFGAFVDWLNRTDVETKSAVWSVGTRTAYLSGLRNVVSVLKDMPEWRAILPVDAMVPSHQWPGAKRQKEPTHILVDNEFTSIYQACLKEIYEIRERVESDLALIEANKCLVPSAVTTLRDYPTRGIALAALAQMIPDSLPCYPELLGKNLYLLNAVRTLFGGIVELRTALAPNPRQLVPFVIMLAIHTRLNPETLLASELDDFTVDYKLGEPRFSAKPFKGRAHRRQRPSAPLDDAWDNPHAIVVFLKLWTGRIRLLAPEAVRSKLLLYVPRTTVSRVSYFDVTNGNSYLFPQLLKEFCTDHGIPNFTLGQIRPTVLDFGRAIHGGDIRAAQVLGDHRSAETTKSHYTSDAQRKRNQERLGEIMNERTRWLESVGRVDTRGIPIDADEGAATPGWRCLDPYASPISPHGKLCLAYAYCATCPLAQVDLSSPMVCAQLLALLEAVRRAKGTMDPQGWLERMAPIEARLVSFWLPRFTKEIFEASRSIPITAMPTPE